MDTRRFERLEESGREPECHTVSIPCLGPPSRREAQNARLSERRPFEIANERGRGFVVADETAAVHVSIAHAMLQRNAPLPAGAMRDGTRVRNRLFDACARRGDGA